jgi:pilus assembly protein Flp/PilA
MKLLLKKPDERGQGLVEYALILVLVAIVVIAVLLVMGPAVSQVYCQVVNALDPGSCGVITSHNIDTGGPVKINVTVKENATVEVTLKDNDPSKNTTKTQMCTPGSCPQITFGGGTYTTGTGIITTVQGDYITFSY